MAERCINLRDWESRQLLANGMLTIVRPVKLFVPYVMDEREDGKPWPYATTWSNGDDGEPWMPSPFGRTGDTLIGREAFTMAVGEDERIAVRFRCDGATIALTGTGQPVTFFGRWRSAATMPAWAARHRLTVESGEGVEVKKCPDGYAWVVKVRRKS